MGEKKDEEEMKSSNNGQGSLIPMPMAQVDGKNGVFAEQDKAEAHFVSQPASDSSDGGKPIQRQGRRNRPTKAQYKEINSFAQDFGPSLLHLMDQDEKFMEEVDINIQNEHYLHDLAVKKISGGELVDYMIDLLQKMFRKIAEVNGDVLPKETLEEMVMTSLKIVFIGVESIESKIANGGTIESILAENKSMSNPSWNEEAVTNA